MNVNEIAAKLTDEQIGLLSEHSLWEACRPVTWPDALKNLSSMEAVWPLLPPEAAHALELIVCGFGALPFKEEQLLQAARPGIAGADLRLGLLRLAEAGIVFAVRRGWGEKLYLLPLDSYFLWHRTITAARSIRRNASTFQALDEVDPLSVEAIDEDGYVPPFSLQLLHALAQMADAGLKLTSRRVLTKRTVGKGAEQLLIQADALAPLIAPASGQAAEAYPAGLLFALETMMQHRWLVEREKAFELDTAAWEEWLHREPAPRETALCRSLIEAVGAQNGPAAAGAAILLSLEAGKWFRLRDIEASFMDSQNLLARPLPSTIEPWSRLLRQLGWIELAADSGGLRVMRWRIEPQWYLERNLEDEWQSPVQQASVQLTPDGDLYVSEWCPYSVRWQLEMIAERRRTDHMTVYRMDTRSYKRAAAAGHSADSLIACVEAMTQEPLPDTVCSMIESGMDIQERVGDRPEQPLGINSPQGETARAASYYQPADGGAYELLQDRISVKHLFAGMDEVPSMWLKQFRAYHPSTRRELMEQALTWRTTVRLNVEGTVTSFIPERIVDEANRWAVAGFLKDAEEPHAVLKLYPEMWEEMMLVLPSPLIGQ